MTINTKKTFSKISRGLTGFFILTAIFYLGEWISGFLPFPVPGAVIGMLAVFLLLQFRILPLKWVEETSVWLLGFLGLFYVPYGVGIVESGALIEKWGLQIVVIIFVTVISVFIVSGWVFQKMIKFGTPDDE